jgi:hypothetical protein
MPANNPTRIRNNQIQDAPATLAGFAGTGSGILANTKIVPQSIVGSLFNPDITIVSNITILGNLTIANSNAYTSVSSINTYINDPLVVFNNGYGGTSPSSDVGILVWRNLQAVSPTNYGSLNSAWVWRESGTDGGSFAALLTTETGTATASINNSGYANVSIGNTIIKTGGAAAGTTVVDSVSSATGALQVQGGAGILGNIVIAGNGSVFGATTGKVAIDSNIPIVQITQSSSTRYGLMITDTNNNGAFAVRTSSARGAEIQTFGGTNKDIYIQPDRLKSIWLPAGNAAVLIDNNINSTLANVGALNVTGSGGIFVGGNINVGTAASFESGHIFVQSNKLNDLAIGKNTLKSGMSANVVALGSMIGTTSMGVNATVLGAAAGPAAVPTNATYVGKSAGNLATGSDSVYIGYNSGSLVTTGQYNVILGSHDGNLIASLSNQVIISDGAGAPRIRVDAAGNVFVVSSVNSTSSNIGAFVVQGGAGIGGNLNVGGPASFSSGRVMLEASQTSILLAGNTATTYLAADSVLIGQKIGSGTTFGIKSTIIGSEAAKTNTSATENTLIGYRAGYSGPGLQTTAVGSQAGLNLLSSATNNQLFGYNAGSQITSGDFNTVIGANTMTGLESVNNYIMLSDGAGNGRLQINDTGVATIYATTQSTSPVSGALVIYGGIGIGGNSYVGGNLTVQGNLNVLGNTTTLGSQNLTIQDSIIELHTFANLIPLTIDDGRDVGIRTHYYKTEDDHAFFGFQNTTQNFVYIQNASESAGVHSGTYGNVQFGSLWLSNTTGSSSETTGALVVKGGMGVGARATINTLVVSKNITATGNGDTLINIQPTGANTTIQLGTVGMSTTGVINNMDIGTTTPGTGAFKDISITSGTTPAGRNATFSGNGYVYIQPTGTVTIGPTATGNMDNIYIGNTTPRQATFTSANVNSDFKLTSFSGNSVMFIDTGTASVVSNLAITQHQAAFNYQRGTANTFATIALSVGHSSQNDLLRQGTDTLNIKYQGDSYLDQASIGSNVVSQTPGWTVSTSRGTASSPLVVQDGDLNGLHGAYAWTGGTPAFMEIAALRYVNQGNGASAGGIGGQAQVWTKRDNGANTIALRIDANQIAEFYGQVRIANTTVSNTTTEGALYVQGGTSIGGNLNVSQGARFNDQQNANRDFFVRGGQDATLIWASTGAYNQVIIGNSAVSANLVTGAKLQVFSTDAMLPPKGSTSQRPGGASGYGSAVTGMLRYNTDINTVEWWDGTQWYNPLTAAVTLVQDFQFNGDNSQTRFNLGANVNTTSTSVMVTINGVVQTPSIAYTMDYWAGIGTNANVVVFSEAPQIGDAIDIRTFALTTTISGISAPLAFSTITTPSDNSGVVITTGETSANSTVKFLNNGGVAYYGTANVSVGTSPTVIDTFPASDFRSARYRIQVVNGSNFEVSEVMVIHNGTTATRTQFNRIYTGASAMGNVTATLSAGNVYLFYQGSSVGNFVKRHAEYITI